MKRCGPKKCSLDAPKPKPQRKKKGFFCELKPASLYSDVFKIASPKKKLSPPKEAWPSLESKSIEFKSPLKEKEEEAEKEEEEAEKKEEEAEKKEEEAEKESVKTEDAPLILPDVKIATAKEWETIINARVWKEDLAEICQRMGIVKKEIRKDRVYLIDYNGKLSVLRKLRVKPPIRESFELLETVSAELNAPKVYALYEHFVVHEYVPGESIDKLPSEYLKANAIEIGESVICLVKSFLEQKYTHGDIKLGNIVWDRTTRTTRFIDMEYFSRLPTTKEPYKFPGFIGTPNYASYELMSNKLTQDEADCADLYALGVLLFYLACFKMPYRVHMPWQSAHTVSKAIRELKRKREPDFHLIPADHPWRAKILVLMNRNVTKRRDFLTM